MKLVLVTDAWYPQINGVVRTLDMTRQTLTDMGHEVVAITPEAFRTIPCPTYPEIRLAIAAGRRIRAAIDGAAPDAIHIATEGPLGLAARNHCVRRGIPFTTSFHTKFPEYLHARFRLPVAWGYRFLRWFHGGARRTMVATGALQAELEQWGFDNIGRWSRGVDVDLFRPRPKSFLDLPRPVWLYVGRVAVEKNVEAFLALGLPGTKVVVGDGPQTAALKARYPDVRFVGAKRGEDLARHYAAGDVFVFPSRTDTFGLVLLEALASGVPVAAYPVTGPRDVIGESGCGVLDEDLGRAANAALGIAADRCRAHAERFAWPACTREFVGNLHPIG